MTGKTLLRGASALLAVLLPLPILADNSATPDGLSLELIMQDPDWIGNPPVNAMWSLEGDTIYFERKREGETFRDLYRLDPATGTTRVLDASERANVPGAWGQYSQDGTRRVYVKNGDVFLADLERGDVRQVTRTSGNETGAMFMADDRRVTWSVGHKHFIFDPATGLTEQAPEIKAEDDPAKDKPRFDYVKDQQTRLFSTLREEQRKEKSAGQHERELAQKDPARVAPAIYLGADVEIRAVSLSPNGRHLLVATTPKGNNRGTQDKMPNYVTDSGYVEVRDVRTLVGQNGPAQQSLHLVDLQTRKVSPLAFDRLTGVKDDPFRSMRKQAIDYHVKNGGDRKQVEAALKAPEMRVVELQRIEWSRNGERVAVQLRAADNKDRWIASVDFDNARLNTEHRLHDNAWINWAFNDMGWLPDNETLWYLSEESGYSQLYVKRPGRRATQLTRGEWEVSDPMVNRGGTHFYFVGNRNHPGEHQVYRVPVSGGEMEQLTDIGVEPSSRSRAGDFVGPFALSPDETQLLFKHDAATRPPELYLQRIGDRQARRLTHTASEEFLSYDWMEPEYVDVPSSHVRRPIPARVYMPPDYDPSKTYPAVMFVHGAGYLHNIHRGWSVYFREFMFHNILAKHGYVVIDMDYRGSAGYGRDWRTAIYRQMGHPELDDYIDGIKWMVENRNVDPERVGIYGGSYGGFLTFMALFRTPDTFAAGASLRPVTDWMHYNHPYTSNILNTPLIDPMAYEKSSPIEFAENYNNVPMLIAHGMQDDNVFFKDSVRLVQRLIELKKENFEIAPYPLDPHAFKHPESWLDEYRRIFKLFENELK